GVLRSLAGLLQTVLLALDDTGVTREVAGLLQGRSVLGIDEDQRAGNPEAKPPGLAANAAASDAGDDVELLDAVECCQRALHQLLVHLVREVALDGATVDLDLTGAGHESHAGNGFL